MINFQSPMNEEMMEPFSVLMAVYDKENPTYFDESLESILVNQTLKPTEVVLVCDGDLTSELEDVIRKYQAICPGILKIYRKKKGGLGKALNFGLPKCTYELVARADSDDICKSDRFERQIKLMHEHPEYGMISSWVDEFLETPGDLQTKRKVPEHPHAVYKYAKSRCPVNHPAVLYRKSIVLNVGGYQEDYFPEDYFLWIKMLQDGCEVYNIQESLVWFRFSPETIKRRGGWSYAKDEIYTQIKIYKLGFISFPIFLKNITIRPIIRLIPHRLRSWIYMKLLRE